ncbi:hypothetical protein [Actinomadura rubrisoli]|uniref:Uncharacterized protein n=1 Tax=Actinomadura rubrisoli TaxID=2530368 RepID=A0A4R5BVZ7_9ACTN|nr:hypothetical protein [Actinomadura rubrisoli]TDD91338.1 hypothetical protein E1298_11960 [Actinomadura rubrisoli]
MGTAALSTVIRSDASLIAEVGLRFPGWAAWRSGTFRWWAYRTAAAALTIGQLRAGCRLIVDADTFTELCSAIGAENDLAHRAEPAAALPGTACA